MKSSTSLRILQSLSTPRYYCKQTALLTSLSIAAKHQNIRSFSKSSYKMSFSNADTGSKPADPYKAKNKDDASIQEKIEGLTEFISASKFGMMTTRDGTSGSLVSRCMALAAKVRLSPSLSQRQFILRQAFRKETASILYSTPTPSLERPTSTYQSLAQHYHPITSSTND